MPLGSAYDKLLKSDVADMKNVGGRWAGSITAAQFLQRFVKEGVALDSPRYRRRRLAPEAQPLHPKGASGWGGPVARPADPDGLRGLSPMAAAWFYHLTRSPVEATLAMLLPKAARRGLAQSRCAAPTARGSNGSTRCSGMARASCPTGFPAGRTMPRSRCC